MCHVWKFRSTALLAGTKVLAYLSDKFSRSCRNFCNPLVCRRYILLRLARSRKWNFASVLHGSVISVTSSFQTVLYPDLRSKRILTGRFALQSDYEASSLQLPIWVGSRQSACVSTTFGVMSTSDHCSFDQVAVDIDPAAGQQHNGEDPVRADDVANQESSILWIEADNEKIAMQENAATLTWSALTVVRICRCSQCM